MIAISFSGSSLKAPLRHHLSTPTGSLAIPAPSIHLEQPHPTSPEDPIHITCEAPQGFPGANFTLYRGRQVLCMVQASADQIQVTFNISGGDLSASGGEFQCQYGVLGEHAQPQISDLSDPVHVSYPGKTPPPPLRWGKLPLGTAQTYSCFGFGLLFTTPLGAQGALWAELEGLGGLEARLTAMQGKLPPREYIY